MDEQKQAPPPAPLALAIRFHETYERLAPNFGYETRKETRAFDPTTPNGKLMQAVCAELLDAAALRTLKPAPIAGYRALDEEEIALINEIKAKGQELDDLLNRAYMMANDTANSPTEAAESARWLDAGILNVQTGFMQVVRAITRPTTFL